MNVGNDSSMSDRERPLLARPRSSAGIVVSRRYFSVVKPWTNIPSHTSPATSVIFSPTAARKTRGVPKPVGPGLKNGVISVWR